MNVTRRWSLVESSEPTEKMLKDLNATSLPSLIAMFPDSTILDKG